MTDFFLWFSGGSRQYHTLYHCLAHDSAMLVVVVFLCVVVGSAYLTIVFNWIRMSKEVDDPQARHALRQISIIFVLCALSGYLFLIVKTVWPAWRLWAILMSLLAYYSWKYAIFSKISRVFFDIQSAEIARRSLKAMSELTDSETRLEIEKLKEKIRRHD